MNERTPVNDGNGHNVPLKEYIERILNEHEKAILLAHADMERRLGELNQLRSEVLSDRSQFVRLDVYDEKHEAMESLIRENARELLSRIDKLEGWRLRATGVFLVLVPLAGVIGAAIIKAFG